MRLYLDGVGCSTMMTDIRKDALKVLGLAITYSMLHLYVFVLVSVFTPGQVTFITRCSILRQFPYGGGRYTMIP